MIGYSCKAKILTSFKKISQGFPSKNLLINRAGPSSRKNILFRQLFSFLSFIQYIFGA